MEKSDLEALCLRLPETINRRLRILNRWELQALEEIRIYACANVEFVIAGKAKEISVRVGMDELLAALSAQALYRCEREMSMGYIPLPGGHRAGICGRMVCEANGTWRMTQVSSVCIRIGRHVPDASLAIRPYLVDEQGHAQRVLVLGAPGSGKTTILRDAALWLSKNGLRVAVADEREELFGMQNCCEGIKLDALSGVDKARALPMLIRTMAPQMMITDEIGSDEDTQAIKDAIRCGVGLLVSAHASSLNDALERPALRELFTQHAFDWYVVLGGRAQVSGVYRNTETGQEGIDLGQLGHSCNGDDCHQCSGILAF